MDKTDAAGTSRIRWTDARFQVDIDKCDKAGLMYSNLKLENRVVLSKSNPFHYRRAFNLDLPLRCTF